MKLKKKMLILRTLVKRINCDYLEKFCEIKFKGVTLGNVPIGTGF